MFHNPKYKYQERYTRGLKIGKHPIKWLVKEIEEILIEDYPTISINSELFVEFILDNMNVAIYKSSHKRLKYKEECVNPGGYREVLRFFRMKDNKEKIKSFVELKCIS